MKATICVDDLLSFVQGQLYIELTDPVTSIMTFSTNSQSRTELRKVIQGKRKSVNQQLKRREETLAKKANELACRYGAKVALIVFRKGRYFVYQSTDWAPSFEEIVSLPYLYENLSNT